MPRCAMMTRTEGTSCRVCGRLVAVTKTSSRVCAGAEISSDVAMSTAVTTSRRDELNIDFPLIFTNLTKKSTRFEPGKKNEGGRIAPKWARHTNIQQFFASTGVCSSQAVLRRLGTMPPDSLRSCGWLRVHNVTHSVGVIRQTGIV